MPRYVISQPPTGSTSRKSFSDNDRSMVKPLTSWAPNSNMYSRAPGLVARCSACAYERASSGSVLKVW
ncbi:Uncharacterised protein [Mycobacterium tuberculosis]|nr:Uncharacterised protein [Mycobacterium tuberculosis]